MPRSVRSIFVRHNDSFRCVGGGFAVKKRSKKNSMIVELIFVREAFVSRCIEQPPTMVSKLESSEGTVLGELGNALVWEVVLPSPKVGGAFVTRMLRSRLRPPQIEKGGWEMPLPACPFGDHTPPLQSNVSFISLSD